MRCRNYRLDLFLRTYTRHNLEQNGYQNIIHNTTYTLYPFFLFLFFLNHPHKMLFLFACPIPSLTNYQDCPPGLFLLYFVKTEGVSLEIYFGPSLNDRALILLEEICALKQYKCSMFYFWCGPHSYCRITHLDRLTFLRTKNRTKLRSNWAVRGTQTLPKQK